METYNYDAAAVPEGDADTTPAAAPETDAAAAGTSDTAQSGSGSQGPVIITYPDSSSNDLQVSPGFGPYGDVMPSLPSNNYDRPNTGGCINCGGSNWKPSPNGALWTWGILSPFFSTSSEIAHLRFYNAASIREPIDIYLNGRLVVSDLDYMNYTRYMHIIPGIYHFSNEGVTSWYDFTKAIHRIAGISGCHVRPIHTEEYPTPARRPHYSVLDKTKIKATYNIEVPYWEESLAECISKLDK